MLETEVQMDTRLCGKDRSIRPYHVSANPACTSLPVAGTARLMLVSRQTCSAAFISTGKNTRLASQHTMMSFASCGLNSMRQWNRQLPGKSGSKNGIGIGKFGLLRKQTQSGMIWRLDLGLIQSRNANPSRHSRLGGKPFATSFGKAAQAFKHQCQSIPAFAGMTG
jgi:hypothetical protein